MSKATGYTSQWMQKLCNAMVTRMAQHGSFANILPLGETRQGIWIRAAYKPTDMYGWPTGELVQLSLLIRRQNFSLESGRVMRITWADARSRRIARNDFLKIAVEEIAHGCLRQAYKDCVCSRAMAVN